MRMVGFCVAACGKITAQVSLMGEGNIMCSGILSVDFCLSKLLNSLISCRFCGNVAEVVVVFTLDLFCDLSLTHVSINAYETY